MRGQVAHTNGHFVSLFRLDVAESDLLGVDFQLASAGGEVGGLGGQAAGGLGQGFQRLSHYLESVSAKFAGFLYFAYATEGCIEDFSTELRLKQ